MPGLGAAAGEFFSKIGTKIPEMMRRSDTGSTVYDIAGAKDELLRMGGEAGQKILQKHMEWQQGRASYLKQLNEPIDKLQEAIFQHPTLSKSVRDDTSLRDIHSQMKAVNHPMAGQMAQQLSTGVMDGNKSMKDMMRVNVNQARVLATKDHYGDAFQFLVPFVMDAYDSKIPTRIKWADTMMSVISSEVHDNRMISTQFGGGKTQVSGLKHDIAGAFKRENVSRQRISAAIEAGAQGLEEKPRLKAIDTRPTYEDVGQIEHRVNNILRMVQLPFVVIKHLPQFGNLASAHSKDLVRGMLGMGDQAFKTHLEASSILAFTEHDILDKTIAGRFGTVSKWTQNPTIGELFHKMYHMPMFDNARHFQLSLSASVGYHSAATWAAQAVHGDRRAILELKEMGLDVAEVIKNGGVLTNEQRTQAMFHFTNNRFFMDKSLERSLKSSSNPWLRSASMYHTFITAESRFIRRELTKMLRAEDYVGIAKFAGTIGILWPAVAPVLKSFEVLGRTASPGQAMASAQEDYDKILHGSFGDRASTYLDLLAHYGAFGEYAAYVSAAHGDRFGYALLGPTVGVPARFASDVINMTTRTNKAGKHNAAPVVRDLLEDTLPIGGNILAHKLAPTLKEQKVGSSRPVRPRRPSRRAREGGSLEF